MGPAEWGSAAFAAVAHEWADERLAELGAHRTGPAALVSVRPWSAVLRMPTASGDVYFKANIPALAHEAGLARLLHGIAPGRVLPVLADDPARGWLLSPDGGPTLRGLVGSAADLPRLQQALAAYAELQVATAGRIRELLSAGAFDYRLRCLVEALPGILSAERPDLAGIEPRYREQCDRLAAFGLPDTVHHDDFHDANMLVGGDGVRFFDWHEGCVAQPFCSLLIVLRVTAWRLELDPEGPELEGLRDAYLEPWTGFGSAAELRRAADLAIRVGRLTRALSWRLIVDGAGSAATDEDREAPAAWLGELAAGLD
jgi:Phosphotransferase enzyme family